MESENREHFVEEQLDTALKHYGKVEPRAGLENRILANLGTERERLRAQRWLWWLAPAAVAGLALVIGTATLLVRRQNVLAPASVATRVASPTANQRADETGMASIGSSGGVPKGSSLRAGRTSRKREAAAPATAETMPHQGLPRLEQFPSPRPLSSQEELLLAFVKQAPTEEVVMAADKAKNAGVLQIDDLEIAPLVPEQAARRIQQK